MAEEEHHNKNNDKDNKEHHNKKHHKEEKKEKQNSDDEITIDFSKINEKISSLFKSKKHSKNSEQNLNEKKKEENDESEEKTEDYEEIDKNKETIIHSKDKNDEDTEISINLETLKPAFNFIEKNWHYLALIIIIIFMIYVRSLVIYAPVTEDWARNTLVNYYSNQIRANIDRQYPNLPATNKQVMVQQQLNQIMKEQKEFIDKNVKELSQQYKKAISYTYNGKDYIYLGDIDSYYWLRFSRNIISHGNICDVIKEGKCYDMLANAPLGREEEAGIHSYAIAYVYKIAHFFGFDIPLMHAAMITPTIIAIIVAIAAFLVGYLLGGKIAAVITTIILSFNAMYLQRSIGSDNDIYNLLFPLIILSFLFLALMTKERKKSIIYAVLSGLFVGFFRFAWAGGWWNIYNAIIYAFIMFIGFIIITKLYIHKKIILAIKNKEILPYLIVLCFFIIGAVIGFIIVMPLTHSTPMDLIYAMTGPISFAKFSKSAVNLNVWPNVLTTVAEFNPIALVNIPQQIFYGNLARILYFMAIFGTALFFIIPIANKKNTWILITIAIITSVFLTTEFALTLENNMYYFIILGIVSFGYLGYMFYSKIEIDEDKQHHLLAGIIVSIWLIGTLFASTKGVRFTMLVVAPVAIAVGFAFQTIYSKIYNSLKNANLGKSFPVFNAIIIIIIFLLPSIFALNSINVTRNFIPNYNAAWDSALLKIRDNSQKDAIVNSWWDFGHWFKYTTERGVTLDGATQNGPQLHWLGKLLLTDNETVSKGILRMLDCGANSAFDVIVNYTNDTPIAVDIINKIIVMEDHDEIKELLLKYDIPEFEHEKILEYSHCEPPENYLITSDDMVGKAGVWAHFGSWDFYKAEIATMRLAGLNKKQIIENISSRKFRDKNTSIIEKLHSELMNKFSDEAINTWIAPWPSYAGQMNCIKQKNSSLYICENGAIFDSEEKECYINSNDGRKYPKKCAFVDGEDVKIKEYNNSLINFQGYDLGFAFYPSENGNMNGIVMFAELTGSMFTRLYFMRGHGLKYFDLFDYQQSPLGTRIFVWKVDWEGKDKNIVFSENKTTEIIDTKIEKEGINITEEE